MYSKFDIHLVKNVCADNENPMQAVFEHLRIVTAAAHFSHFVFKTPHKSETSGDNVGKC